MASDYTAANIRILSPDEVKRRWFWAEAGELATRYKRPQQWIERGLRACEAVGVDHSYFVSRYLKKLPIPRNESVEAAYRELR